MSIFARIDQIERQMTSLENALDTKMSSKSSAGSLNTPQDAASFQSMINSMTSGQRFDPAAAAINSSSITGSNSSGDSAQFDSIIKEASEKYNVDPALIKAVIRQESAFNPQATSVCGAQGLMQLMPETASDLGVKNAYDPKENIMGGAKYLGQLLDMFNGDMTKTIAAYNAGPGSVQQYGGVPPYQETQNYVDKVLGYYQENKGISA
ncbi:MAG: lytic transglycosylase domain-containing protein [Candidatus Bruticola sp.]